MKDLMAYCPKCEEKRWFERKGDLEKCPICKKEYTIKYLIQRSQNDRLPR
jgi:transposase-like protein